MRFIALCLTLFATSSLLALYCGNPSAPAMVEEGFFFTKEGGLGLTLGYQKDIVFDRRMKAEGPVKGHFDTFEIWMDQGAFTITLIDRFEGMVTLGAAKIAASQSPRMATLADYLTHDQLTWGATGRILVFQTACWSIGVEGGYQWTQPHMSFIGLNGAPLTHSHESKVRFREWQVGLGASYQIDIFIPYITFKYSNANAHFKAMPESILTGHDFHATNRNKFGMALGTSLTTGRLFSLTAEVRLIDESALTLSGELKF